MSKKAWVTLATNDSYALGALVVAYSLKRVQTVYELVVLITPGVTESMRTKLSTVFNVVKEVNVLDSQDAANLALLSRPELGITFTKLHCWQLTQYEKCVFLDADTLVLQNSDELFDREELSAAPDVGWPDCFNSGVFVYRPSTEQFKKLLAFAIQYGSFDGGDQGLLNKYFSDWARQDISKHLPFIYNTCSTACYSYLPAFKQFGADVKILHFIGQLKPWLVNFDSTSKRVYTPEGFNHITQYLQLWWNIFCEDVHSKLSTDMNQYDQQVYTDEWYNYPDPFQFPEYHSNPDYSLEPHSQPIIFSDPWDSYYEQQMQKQLNDQRKVFHHGQTVTDHQYNHQQYDNSQSQSYTFSINNHQSTDNLPQSVHFHSQQVNQDHLDHGHNNQRNIHCHQNQDQNYHANQHHAHQHHDHKLHDNKHHEHQYHNHQYHEHQHHDHQHHDHEHHDHQHHDNQHHDHQHHDHQHHDHQRHDHQHHDHQKQDHQRHDYQRQDHTDENHGRNEHHHDHQHHDHNHRHRDKHNNDHNKHISLHPIPSQSHPIPSFTYVIPSHPEQIVLRNDESLAPTNFNVDAAPISSCNNLGESNVSPTVDATTSEESGLAGALAKLTLGTARTAEQEAYEQMMRRQCWEAGNIDYLGKDSFDNIWKRITQTLESKPADGSDGKRHGTPPKPAATGDAKEGINVDRRSSVSTKTSSVNIQSSTFQSTHVQERRYSQVTSDGKTIETIVRSTPGEESQETQEYAVTKVGDETIETLVKTTPKTVTPIPATTDAPNVPAQFKEPIVIVPGHTKVEYDSVTGAKIVTEKTTTGYQQTITTVTEDGRTKTQTKTFFDAVEIPGEEIEEEETYEETTQHPTSVTTYIKANVTDEIQITTEEQSDDKEVKQQVTKQTTEITDDSSQTDIQKTIVEIIPANKPTSDVKEQEVVNVQKETETVNVQQQEVVEDVIVKKRSEVANAAKEQEKPNVVEQRNPEDIEIVEKQKIVQQQIDEQQKQLTEQTTTTVKQEENITEETTTKVTSDGKTIQTIVRTIPGEEVEVVEEIETTQIGDKKIGETVTRSEPKKTVRKAPANSPQKPREPVVIVPGHQKVEIDEVTGTKTVTEKTTTGYQQTITKIVNGKTVIETKTFYDEVDLPVEEEEEVEEYEETETFLPAPEPKVDIKTTIGTVDEIQKQHPLVDLTQTGIQHISTEETEEKKTTRTAIVTRPGQDSSEVTKHEKKVEKREQRTETKQTNQQQQVVTATTVSTKSEKKTSETKTGNTQQVIPAVEGQPKTKVVKKTNKHGDEVELATTVSADGKTKTKRKTVNKPEEEIEIEEYEETTTVDPGQVRFVTKVRELPTGEQAIDQTMTAKASKEKTATQQKQTKNEHGITTVDKSVTAKTTTEIKVSQQQQQNQKQITNQTNQQQKQITNQTNQTNQQQKQITNQTNQQQQITQQQTTNQTNQKIATKQTDQSSTKKSTDSATTTKKTKTDKSTTALVRTDDMNVATTDEYEVISTRVVPSENEGDVTTEEVRRIAGGTETIWKLVRPDGSMKMWSKTFYDTVAVSEETRTEKTMQQTITGGTITDDKKKLPALAPASKTAPTAAKKKEVKKPTKGK